MIVGGGRLGEALAELLREAGVRVKLIEHNAERCRELAERLPDVSVLCADGTRQDFLFSENISQMDAVVALTNLDEGKCVYLYVRPDAGRAAGDPKVDRTEYAAVCQNCGIRSTVSPKDICAQEISRLCPRHGEHRCRERPFRIQSAERGALRHSRISSRRTCRTSAREPCLCHASAGNSARVHFARGKGDLSGGGDSYRRAIPSS